MITVQISKPIWTKKPKFSSKWKSNLSFQFYFNFNYLFYLLFILGWILPDHTRIYFADCKFCMKRLRAKTHCLKTYAKSVRLSANFS